MKIGFIELMVGSLALFVAYMATRVQTLSIVHGHLAGKSNEANQYLNEDMVIEENDIKVSGIVTAIITAEQIINRYRKWYWFFCFNKSRLLDIFYLQLHSSIRVWVQTKQVKDLNTQNELIKNQFKHIKQLLMKSSLKIDNEIKYDNI